jgi:cyclic pyranopterin phosphate synthase
MRLLGLLHREFEIRRVRFTGGEPLLRRDLPELIGEVRALGIPELALTTNAQLLAPCAVALKEAGLQRINISLDSLRSEVFARITRGGILGRTLAGIQAARLAGLGPVKLNVVVLRGVNDAELGDLLRFALQTGCHLRFLELMPVGEAAAGFADGFVSVAEMREQLGELGYGWQPLPWDSSETSRDFLVRDADGRETVCGFITPTSEPFCTGCRRLRFTSDGWLHGCLARFGRQDLKPLLGLDEEAAAHQIRGVVRTAFAQKQCPRFEQTVASMADVGG